MNRDVESKTFTTPRLIEEVLAPFFKKIIDDGGIVGILLLLLGTICGLYVKLFSKSDIDSLPFLSQFFRSQDLSVSSILLLLSIISTFIFFIIVIFKHIYSLFYHLILWLGTLMRVFINHLVNFIQKILILSNKKQAARTMGRYVSLFNRSVYAISSWREPSELALMQKQLPIDVANFSSLECDIIVHKSLDHYWRAGIVFETAKKEQYIFHIFEEPSLENRLQYRVLLRYPDREVKDKRGTVGSILENSNKIRLEKIDQSIEFYLNGEKVTTFDVPLEFVTSLFLAAWADNRPFDIEFKNIEAVG